MWIFKSTRCVCVFKLNRAREWENPFLHCSNIYIPNLNENIKWWRKWIKRDKASRLKELIKKSSYSNNIKKIPLRMLRITPCFVYIYMRYNYVILHQFQPLQYASFNACLPTRCPFFMTMNAVKKWTVELWGRFT